MSKELEKFVDECDDTKGKIIIRTRAGISAPTLGAKEVFARCDSKKATRKKLIEVPLQLKQKLQNKIDLKEIDFFSPEAVKHPKRIYDRLEEILAGANGINGVSLYANGNEGEIRVCTETLCYIFPVEKVEENGEWAHKLESCMALDQARKEAKTPTHKDSIKDIMDEKSCTEVLKYK